MEEELTGSMLTVGTKKSDKRSDKGQTLGHNMINQSSRDVYPMSTDGMTIQNSQKAIINQNKDNKGKEDTIQTSTNIEK